MYVFHVEDTDVLRDLVVENLKLKGVRCRWPKKTKEEKEVPYSVYQTFQKPLHLLQKCRVSRKNGSTIEIPVFLADVCNIIEKNLDTEGLFRKAGSTCKQRESKVEVNSGKKLDSDYHVIDACNLVKLFFRELPQPILPYISHEILLKCLLLTTVEKQVEAMLLSCLLIPMENIATLAFFMEFLLKVSKHSNKNKMDVKNLAIILTPSLMPVDDQSRSTKNLKITHHIKVIEMLIENAERIGLIPEHLQDCIQAVYRKSKKKRRSGSITRMFSGLKKIVSNRGSSTPEWDALSVCSETSSQSSARKRKAADVPDGGLSTWKKRQVLDHLPEGSVLGTPLMSRMNSYAVPVAGSSHPVPANLKRVRSRSPRATQRKLFGGKSVESFQSALIEDKDKKKPVKKQKSTSQLFARNSETQRRLERRLSFISWGKKKTSRTNLFLNRSAPDNEGEEMEMQCLNPTAEDVVMEVVETDTITIPKKEFEEIKNRVCALEQELGNQLGVAHSVQDVYEKTLEHSERITAEDHLAGRFNRELKIRRSADNKVIRSPSARKIGSIRRRSRELIQKNMEKLSRSESVNVPKSNLRRGRPNTVQTGLPSPGTLRTVGSMELVADIAAAATACPVQRSSSMLGSRPTEHWHSGEEFFTKKMLARRLIPLPQGRPSIAEIRHQRAGLVLERAKLFNSLNQSDEKQPVQRRQSMRLESLRRSQEMANSAKKIGAVRTKNSMRKRNKSPSLETKENEISQDLKETIYDVCTPLSQKLNSPLREVNRTYKTPRQVPTIKKSLGTRSPRHLVKTPLSSQCRPRATPLKAFAEPAATPRRGIRRSPRILARLAAVDYN